MLSEDEDEYIQNLILGFEKSYQPYMPTLLKRANMPLLEFNIYRTIDVLFLACQLLKRSGISSHDFNFTYICRQYNIIDENCTIDMTPENVYKLMQVEITDYSHRHSLHKYNDACRCYTIEE